MKVLLLKDISKIGQKGQIVNIKEGYALNYILPNKLGIKADQKIILQKEKELNLKKTQEEIQKKLLEKDINSLKGKVLNLNKKANSEGHLFAQIKISEILEAIHKEWQIKIPEKYIKIKEPIKEIGEYDLGIIQLKVLKE